jgi:hypothetical protein
MYIYVYIYLWGTITDHLQMLPAQTLGMSFQMLSYS